MSDNAWVSASVRFSRKGKRAERPTILGENWIFGKSKPIDLSVLIVSFAKSAAEFAFAAGLFDSVDELNKEVERAEVELSHLRFESVYEEVGEAQSVP